MRFRFQFLHVDVSEALKSYSKESFEKVGKLLLKDSSWQVFISKSKFNCCIKVDVRSPWGHFKAQAREDDFYLAVDRVAEKLGKQFHKRKERLQNHKKFGLSRGGKVLRLNPEMGTEFNPGLVKKTA